MPPVPLHVVAFKSPLPCTSMYFCYHHLLICSPLLAVAANVRHPQSYPSLSACQAQLCASWAPAQDHALGDRSRYSLEVYFTHFCMCLCLFFVLVLFALWQPFPSYPSSWTLNLIAVSSMSCPLSCSMTHTFIGFNLFTRPFAYDTTQSVAGWTLTLQSFSFSFSPFLLTLVHSVQLSLLTQNHINTIAWPCWTAGNCGPLPLSFSCMPFWQLFVWLQHFTLPFFDFATCFSYVPILTHTMLTIKDPCVQCYLGTSPAAVRD